MTGLFVAALLAAGPVRTVDVKVTDKGFEPARIEVKQGEHIRLLVTRKTDKTCATELRFEGEAARTKLPLNVTVPVDFTAKKPGTVKYACAMGMVSGVLVVQ